MNFQKIGRLLLMAVMLLVVVIPMGSVQAASTVNNFYNVIMQDGADPWVYKHTDNYYYFTKTTGGDVTIWKSKTLTGIDAAEETRVVQTGCCGIWAPEIHYINNAWYIYYAKDDGNNINHRMYVMENTNADPMQGNWVYKGQITDSSNKWAIDGTVLNNGGSMYFIWSGWPDGSDGQQNLYIAHMSNPWTIDSARTLISTPTNSWETNQYPNVNEGPQVIIRNGVINLVYSASGSWSNDYCLGLITAGTGSSLLQASSWTKRSQPIFQSANGLYGPGHHSFTKSPDGTEDWILYHTAKFNGAGWNREIRAQKFTWNIDNTPNLGAPVNPNTPIAAPSGESNRVRYEGESGLFNGGAYAASHPSASGGSKAGHIDNNDSYVEFDVNAAAEGTYILLARVDNGTNDWSALKLSINNGAASNLYVTNKGWDNWSIATARVNLNAGNNKVRFAHGTGYAELDCFDILSPVTRAGSILSGSVYKLINTGSGNALDVSGAGTANGTNVQIWQDLNNGAQEWQIVSLGDGTYKLVNPSSGKALDVDGALTANGTNVQIWQDFNGGIAQKWTITNVGGGSFKLINPNSGRALDVDNGGTANGTNVRIWDDNGSNAQKWQLVLK